MSLKELDDLNTKRGEFVAKALDSKNVFVSDDQNEQDSKEAKMTTMQYLNSLDNGDFKTLMDKLFAEGTKMAKLVKYGESIGVSEKDIKKYKEELDYAKKHGFKAPKNKEVERNKDIIESKEAIVISVKSY